MAKWAQGLFTPKNPKKYVGNHQPKYRSGWELQVMRFLDENESIQHWASESIRIPYRHPFTGKQTIYVPDFFVVYQNKHGKKLAEIVEIKPKKQSMIESNSASQKDKMVVAVNHAKWQAAMAYCKNQGYTFRVVTEQDLFRNGKP